MQKKPQTNFTSKLSILVLALAALAVFWGVTKTFYQQDEWHGVGLILSSGLESIFLGKLNIPSIILGEGRLATNILVYFFYNFFPFNVFPIAIFIITLHIINTILVFILAKKITHRVFPAFLGALFFAVNAVSQGAVTWPASGLGTIPATSLIILSIFTFLEFIDSNKKKWVILTFFILYISLFFKETAIPFLLFFPFSYLFIKRIPIKNFLKIFGIFFVLLLTIAGFRLFQLKSIPNQQDLFLTGATKYFVPTLLIRTVLYPLTSFSLMWIPSEPIFTFAKHITWIYYPFFPPTLYDLVAQTTVLDTLAIFLTLVFLFTVYLLFKDKKWEVQKWVIFFLGFITLSFMPYIVISKSFSYLESRYYYIALVGGGVLLSLIITRLSAILNSKIFNIFVLILLSFIFVHLKSVGSEIEKQISLGQERIKILQEITNIKPSLSNKTIFYLTGDRTYYITTGNYVPMQQGMGNTLLVWYMAHGSAPKELSGLIKKYYLWEIDSQGYEEVGGIGFGYFWDKNKLNETLLKNKLNMDNVTAFYYDSTKGKIEILPKPI